MYPHFSDEETLSSRELEHCSVSGLEWPGEAWNPSSATQGCPQSPLHSECKHHWDVQTDEMLTVMCIRVHLEDGFTLD